MMKVLAILTYHIHTWIVTIDRSVSEYNRKSEAKRKLFDQLDVAPGVITPYGYNPGECRRMIYFASVTIQEL